MVNRWVIISALLWVAGCASAPSPAPKAGGARSIDLYELNTPAHAPAPEAGDGGRVYRRMLDAALANPAAADWAALRQAYAASPAYDPFVGEKPGAPNAIAAMSRGDWQGAASIADAAAAANTMDLRAQLNAAIADRHVGRLADADRHHAITMGLMHAILATGNGATPQTSFHVLGTSEEYVVLDVMHMRRGRQALVHLDGHAYDQLSCTHIPDGVPGDVWFNIDVSLAGETSVVTGQRHPIPQSDLPPG
jgi:hypothetical protein